MLASSTSLISPGVAGAATEHPLERVESNEVRTRGKPPPPIYKSTKADLCSRHLYAVSRKRLVLTSRVGESEVQTERSYKATNCVMSQLLLRDATKSPELFDKSVKVYLNLAEAEVAKHYNFVKSLSVESLESYTQA